MEQSKKGQQYIEKYSNIYSIIKLISGDNNNVEYIFREFSKKCGDNIFSKNSVKLLDKLEQKLKDNEIINKDLAMINKQLAYSNITGEALKGYTELPDILFEYAQAGNLNILLNNDCITECNEISNALLERLNSKEINLHNDIFGISNLSGNALIEHKKKQLKLLNVIFASKYNSYFDIIFADFKSRKFNNFLEEKYKARYNTAIIINCYKNTEIAIKLEEHLKLANIIIKFNESIVRGLPDNITLETISLFEEALNINEIECNELFLDALVILKEYTAKLAVYDNNRDANRLTKIDGIPQNAELTSKFGVEVLELKGERVKLLTHVVLDSANWTGSGSTHNRQEVLKANAQNPEDEYSRQHRSRFFSKNTGHLDNENVHQISTSFFDTASIDMDYKPKVGSVVHIFNGVDPLQIMKTVFDTEGTSYIYRGSNTDDFTFDKNAKREVAVALEKIVSLTDSKGRKSLAKDQTSELIHPTALLAIVDDQYPQIPERTIIQAKAWKVPIILMRAEDYPIIDLTYTTIPSYELQASTINK